MELDLIAHHEDLPAHVLAMSDQKVEPLPVFLPSDLIKVMFNKLWKIMIMLGRESIRLFDKRALIELKGIFILVALFSH